MERDGGSMVRSTRWRVVLATALLVAFAVFVGRQIVPSVSPLQVVAWAFAGAAGLLAILAVVAACSMAVRQFVLNRGGTDAQWLAFGEEPPGLVRLREAGATRGPRERSSVRES